MSCSNVCKLCPKLNISDSITFTAGTGLIINIPQNSFRDGEILCIVLSKVIPPETTITAPTFITIGDGTVQYPLVKCDCSQVLASSLRTRTRYRVRVSTNATGGVFKLLGRTCCSPNNSLRSIDGTAPAAPAVAVETASTGKAK